MVGDGTLNEDSPGTDSGVIEKAAATVVAQFANAAAGAVGYAVSALFTEGPKTGVSPLAGGMNFQSRGAGDGIDYPYGVWGAYQHTDFEDNFAATAYDADTDVVIMGADFSPFDNMVFGAALGYENTDADTTFNGGNIETDGITIMPYMGVFLSDSVGVDFDLSADMAIGLSFLDIEQFRTNAAGARVTSSTNSDRAFISGNVSAAQSFGNWYVGGRVGLLYAKDDIDGFTESDTTAVAAREVELGRLSLGGNIAYTWDSFEPFASATYQHDFSFENIRVAGATQPENDVNDILLGFGVRWYGESGVTASLEYNTVVGRDDFDSDTFNFYLRADF